MKNVKKIDWSREGLTYKDRCVICDSCQLEEHEAEFFPFIKERMFHNHNDETKLYHCKNCNFYYSSLRPNDDNMATYYAGYRGEEYQKRRQFFEPGYTEKFNLSLGYSPEQKVIRNEIITNVLDKYIDYDAVKCVLDYGGDAGQYIPNCFNKAKKYVFDISNVKTVDGVEPISKNDLSSKKWDFIMCCHVLEHVSYPMDIITEMVNLLSDGGYLYIEVPYENYAELDKFSNDIIKIHEHINFFRKETFQTIFERPDIRILENKIVNVPLSEGKNLAVLLKKINDVENPIYNKIVRLENKIDQFEKVLLLSKKNVSKPNFIEKIFSVKNDNKKSHKVITILGLKFKLKRKKHAKK